MSYFSKTYKIVLFSISLLCSIATQAQVGFKASAPQTVEKGQQFRLSYTLNKEGKDIRLPDIKGFEILFGPSFSSSFSQSIINGKSTSESSFTYTYILMAEKEGTYTIAPASISVDGSTYKSNPLTIKVLPPDKNARNRPGSSGTNNEDAQQSRSSGSATVKASDAFIRTIISKHNVYEQEAFTVTFRLYTIFKDVYYGNAIEFPEFEGFMVEETPANTNKYLEMERYNGRNYYAADLRKILLFPLREGKINIPSGEIELIFTIPSGKKVSTFLGPQEVTVEVKKPMVTNPVSIDVKALPENKPANFSGAVGSFSFKPSISTQNTRANEAITVKLEISGTGNMKLIRNPEVKFPTNFETYDPTVNNAVNVTANGLTGVRTIEYLAIPRNEGSYTIPPIEFSYFDINTRTYKTEKSPEYTINVAKGDPSKASSENYVNQRNVEVEKDIRFLKTSSPAYQYKGNFFVDSFGYWLWYILPAVLLLALYLFNRKRVKENANVALMRTRKANKTAVKRLKIAEKYLKEQNKEKFYDETLRALWGYFSDKLSIPLASLSKDNIEAELSKYGINDALIAKFTSILNACEFARYAPAESNAAMDNLYNETAEAISEMENKLKRKDNAKNKKTDQ